MAEREIALVVTALSGAVLHYQSAGYSGKQFHLDGANAWVEPAKRESVFYAGCAQAHLQSFTAIEWSKALRDAWPMHEDHDHVLRVADAMRAVLLRTNPVLERLLTADVMYSMALIAIQTGLPNDLVEAIGALVTQAQTKPRCNVLDPELLSAIETFLQMSQGFKQEDER